MSTPAYRKAHKTEIAKKNRQYTLAHKDELAAYRLTHKDKAAAYHRANNDRRTAYRLKYKDKIEAYNLAHRDEASARTRAYNLTHKTEITAHNLNYYLTHKDKMAAYTLTRRAAKANATINDFTAKEWNMVKAHYKYTCVYCKKKSKRLTMDHITPLSKGGNHTLANIVPSCRSCNSHKGTRLASTMVQPLLL